MPPRLPRHSMQIRLLTVVDLDKHNGKTDNHNDEAASLAWVETQIEEAESHLRPVAERFEGHGLKPEMEVRFGNPPAEILKAASEYGTDIIAMATRSRRGVARLMFGSVADQVLRESHVLSAITRWQPRATISRSPPASDGLYGRRFSASQHRQEAPGLSGPCPSRTGGFRFPFLRLCYFRSRPACRSAGAFLIMPSGSRY
jgi:nucleotide-binding universal stress UspA family protein